MADGTVRWGVHLSSLPERVYSFLATDEGRAWFWAESAVERDGSIEFRFPNGVDLRNHDRARTWSQGFADN